MSFGQHPNASSSATLPEFSPSTSVTLLQGYFPSLGGRVFLCLWAYANLHALRHLGSRLLLWLLLTTITQAENIVHQEGKILSKCLERSAWLWKLDSAFKQHRTFGDGGWGVCFLTPQVPKIPLISYATWGISTAVLGRHFLRLPRVSKRM